MGTAFFLYTCGLMGIAVMACTISVAVWLLEAGKAADVVVLSKNLFEVAPAEILTTEVDMTVFNGQVVYER